MKKFLEKLECWRQTLYINFTCWLRKILFIDNVDLLLFAKKYPTIERQIRKYFYTYIVTNIESTVKKYSGKKFNLECDDCGKEMQCQLYEGGLFLCESCAVENGRKLFNKENLKL
jgi:peptide subunit release factor 1 (eRF1)